MVNMKQIHSIIHGAAAASAGVGAGLAQIPGSDAVAIIPLQTAMIMGIARAHGVPANKQLAIDILLTSGAKIVGRSMSRLLVGWIPGIGNAINAATAAALTEAIGWAAHKYFAAYSCTDTISEQISC